MIIGPALRRLIAAKASVHQLPAWVSMRYSDSFLPSDWIEGLIMVESSGNPRARRYEPAQDRAGRIDARTDPDAPGVDDGELEDDASYGLMQVMGYNVRALCGGVPLVLEQYDVHEGTRVLPAVIGRRAVRAESITQPGAFWAPMNFGFALLPDTNITLGIRMLLAELAAVGGDVERALARFNGGSTGDDVKPEYANDMRLRRYVDRVYQATVIASRR